MFIYFLCSLHAIPFQHKIDISCTTKWSFAQFLWCRFNALFTNSVQLCIRTACFVIYGFLYPVTLSKAPTKGDDHCVFGTPLLRRISKHRILFYGGYPLTDVHWLAVVLFGHVGGLYMYHISPYVTSNVQEGQLFIMIFFSSFISCLCYFLCVVQPPFSFRSKELFCSCRIPQQIFEDSELVIISI